MPVQKVRSACMPVQKHSFKVRKYIVNVQKHTSSNYKSALSVQFRITKYYFQRTKAYLLRTKLLRPGFDLTTEHETILSKHKKHTSNVDKYACKAQQEYVERTTTTQLLETLSRQKGVRKKKHIKEKSTFKAQQCTFEVQRNRRKPWPGTLVPRVPGTQFPKTVPSKPPERNLTPRNPSKTETFETFFTQRSEPEPWTAKPVGTYRNPESRSRNPVPSRNRPSSLRTHQNLYFAKTP